MLCYSGKELQEYIEKETERTWKQRDFLTDLDLYLKRTRTEVLGISGLRGTGKTVGLLQFLKDKNGVYICAQIGDDKTVNDYIELLKTIPNDIIVLDEYPWIKGSNKDELDAFLYTLTQNGKKVIITGTESIAIDALQAEKLIHRIKIVNVNHFSYDEYCRMNDLEKNKENCKQYLMKAGVFPQYIVNSFQSMINYVKNAVSDNLTFHMKGLDKEKAAAIVYTILYKAVCDSAIKFVPQIKENRETIESFLNEIGVDSEIEFTNFDFQRVSSVLIDAGVIISVPNYENNEEFRTYIVNPALTYQMLCAVHHLEDLPDKFKKSLYGYMFEASCVVHINQQLCNTGWGEDKLYYMYKKEGDNQSEIDFLIENTSKHSDIYLFECKLNDGAVVKEKSSLVSDFTENLFAKEIGGRYAVYNGPHNFDVINDKEILYVGMDNLLSQYYSFSANKATILQEVKDRGELTYLEEKQRILEQKKKTKRPRL